MTLLTGVSALNVVFLAVGYCVLASTLGRLELRRWASYAGVALIVGAGCAGIAVTVACIAGATASPATLLIAAAILATAGLAARGLLGGGEPTEVRATPAGGVALAATAAIVAVCALALLGGFRSSPWLDDAWGIWLAKGVALGTHGLDSRLFVPNGKYVFFEVGDYPLWWSVVSELNMRFVGSIDVRAMDAQESILLVSFLAATARLLWGRVRAWVLAFALLLLVASPELLRHTQSGMADLPLAIFYALFVLAGLRLLVAGDRLSVVLVVVCGAAALAIKIEALPEVTLSLPLLVGAGLVVARRRVPQLVAATAVAYATMIPWWTWRASHHIGGRLPLGTALDPTYLAHRAHRIGTSAATIASDVVDPTKWLLAVPLLCVAAVAGAWWTRRVIWLAPIGMVALGYLLLVWIYWSAPDNVDYLLATSAYRTVDPLVLLSGVLLPPTVELLLQQRDALRQDRVLVGNLRDDRGVVQQHGEDEQ